MCATDGFVTMPVNWKFTLVFSASFPQQFCTTVWIMGSVDHGKLVSVFTRATWAPSVHHPKSTLHSNYFKIGRSFPF